MNQNMKKYVQYGCGLSAPEEWANYDTSPTLKIQKIPILRIVLKRKFNTIFPKNVLVGDIIKGLPIKDNSCDGVYCSHVLEHLSLEAFQIALRNTYKILKTGGIFRLVMPDLEYMIQQYLENKNMGKKDASVIFMKESGMALESRPKGLKAIAETIFGNSKHLWLWDNESTIIELENVGFKNIRKCEFHDCSDKMFNLVEDKGRMDNAICLEMTK